MLSSRSETPRGERWKNSDRNELESGRLCLGQLAGWTHPSCLVDGVQRTSMRQQIVKSLQTFAQFGIVVWSHLLPGLNQFGTDLIHSLLTQAGTGW